jgi:excinuclease UvrABC nuclease subunit
MEEELIKLDEKHDEINIQFDNIKQAIEFVEKARKNIEDYLETETELDEADDWLFNALTNLKSQLNILKWEEDDIIEQEENLSGSHTEDSQYMSQWEFIDKNNCNRF